jgi:uncharacterized protein
MSLMLKITEDIKTAMKSQDKDRLGVLRMVLADLKNAKVASSKQEDLSDERTQEVLSAYAKKLKKSLDDYPSGDARSKIENEIHIVQSYLPAMASDEEIVQVIHELLAQSEKPQFGQLMKELNTRFKARADGQKLSSLLKHALPSA